MTLRYRKGERERDKGGERWVAEKKTKEQSKRRKALEKNK